jgi:hypothetical protein
LRYQEQNRRFANQLKVAMDVFDRPIVVLELPPGQECRPEAVSAFALAANLLARLFTRLHLVAPDAAIGPHPWSPTSLHQIGADLADISEGSVDWSRPSSADIVLGIGAAPTVPGVRSTFASFNGWLAGVDWAMESNQPGIFGALLAACYGAAQAFLHATAAVGGHLRPMRPFQLSLLDFSHSPTNAETPTRILLPDSHLVGVGAVGSALIYALGHLLELDGSMQLIDNDLVGVTNLQRYVLMRKKNVGEKKTDIAAEVLRRRGLRANSYPVSFKEYTDKYGHRLNLLITPVDSEAGRRYLATCLPRFVLNAATGQSTVTLSRHGFADGRACLHCLYLQPREQVSTEQRLARDLGLPLEAVVRLLAENKPIDEAIVQQVERHRGVELGKFSDGVGQHIQSFYQRTVCGQAAVQTDNGTLTAPLSFISATAGILLAAELVKSSVPGLNGFSLDNYFRVDALHAPNPDIRERRLQDPTRECICWDADYIDIYRKKYSMAS